MYVTASMDITLPKRGGGVDNKITYKKLNIKVTQKLTNGMIILKFGTTYSNMVSQNKHFMLKYILLRSHL